MAKRDMGTRTMTNSEMQIGNVMFEQLDARGPRLVAQKAIETFLGEALLPAPDAEARSATEQSYRGPGLGLDLDGPHLRRPRQPDDANVCGQERRSLPLLCVIRPARWPGGCRERPRCADDDDEALAGARTEMSGAEFERE